MKRVHRRRHLAIWILLVPIIGFIVWQAIIERPDAPVLDTLPISLLEESE